ncbi:3-keto-5-aminohexanoate cleavage protein [Streptomyces sp. NPDC004647]|uniref:3-keto-5-aminohexanoate cleavage protein n=1 Tax=Streptomyces sp. NPDC004647 TaxID=3154671 RepID=UPI0033A22DD6
MLQVCLNGSRNRAECPLLPISADELAVAARDAVKAGAEAVHLHPKKPDGTDTLDPAIVAETVTKVRAAVPGIPIGVTTGAWTTPDPQLRAELVRQWTALPDYASANWHENGVELVVRALLEKDIGVEAGIYSGTDAATRFRVSPLADSVIRVLAEVMNSSAKTATLTGERLLSDLRGVRAPILLHGENEGAWSVLRMAARLHLDTRIGLEDVLHDPEGTPTASNPTLVRAAKHVLSHPDSTGTRGDRRRG